MRQEMAHEAVKTMRKIFPAETALQSLDIPRVIE
jgi:hypothetical protein